ncbi:MAG: hypothetical protein WHV44_02520 [Anaerolineales bacterium]
MKKLSLRFFAFILVFVTLSACAAQSTGPVLVAPDPTSTLVLPTFSPRKTPEPLITSTPAPAKPDASRSALLTQSDGSILFTDFKGNYSLVFPPNWTLVRVNEKEYESLMLNQALTDNLLQTYLMAYRNRDGATYRLFAFDLAGRVEVSDYLTNVEIYLDDRETITVKQARLNLEKARQKDSKIVEALASKDITTSSGYEVGIYRAILETRAVTAQKSTIYYSAAVITPYNTSLLIITFGAPVELRDKVETFMDDLLESYRETR